MLVRLFFTWVLIPISLLVNAQSPDYASLRSQLAEWRERDRGPYRDIRWFCKDGSIREARDPCPDSLEGVQRARYSPELIRWGERYHLFPAQILATTDKVEFWDAPHHQSRLKQYQLDQFMRRIDNGWILEKAQYYRGAVQIEDEQEWGEDFLLWLLRQPEILPTHYFLIRQAVLTLPHRQDSPQSLEMRALSKELADRYPAFMSLRVKIHGQPGREDLTAVQDFADVHQERLDSRAQATLSELQGVMEEVYAFNYYTAIGELAKRLPADHRIRAQAISFAKTFSPASSGLEVFSAASDLLRDTRDALLQLPRAAARLAALDIGVLLEQLLRQRAGEELSASRSVGEQMDYLCYLEQAVYATGFVSEWEWAAYQRGQWGVPDSATMELGKLLHFAEQSRRLLEWSANTGRALYQHEVAQYSQLNPAAVGFVDDLVRSSILLPLGQYLDEFSAFAGRAADLQHFAPLLGQPSGLRGLNPGFAKGELVVVGEGEEVTSFDQHKIYVFDHPPADLKPVAGIATVTEGNMVSHVQLLARNLGIPNAVLSSDNLRDLRRWHGEEVFYAVSLRGTVILKKASEMEEEEQALFAVTQQERQRIMVPLDQMELDRRSMINLRELTAASSGRWCGPKAANLGQLKQFFPEQVVEGLVIPFGAFRAHMDQQMPGQSSSYWGYLQRSFAAAAAAEEHGQATDQIRTDLLARLDTLRQALQQIPFLPGFEEELAQAFRDMLGQELGEIPVFLRSDTNMEDLPEFTGAGLNLTLFNVRDRSKILQGIREVWASPYTERSFRWRQQYLLNPENVYPSLLLIPGVNVDYSGVVITKGVVRGVEEEITAAFSWGVGGAVDGQRAETYVIYPSGHLDLLSPARELEYKYLPSSGGVKQGRAAPQQPILNLANLSAIYELAAEVETKFPELSDNPAAAYDIELGFKDDQLWLFQVRPFVENRQAASSGYLRAIDPRFDPDIRIDLTQRI
jgi:hypothetical protein